MDDKKDEAPDPRTRFRKIEEWLVRIGAVYGGLAAVVVVGAFLLKGVIQDDDPPPPPPSPAASTPTETSLAEYCERADRYASAWLEFQSAASRGEATPGVLRAALDNLYATEAVAPEEVKDELGLLASAVEQFDEDLSGDPLTDGAAFLALFVTNVSVGEAVDRIDAFDAEHCAGA